MRQALKRAAIVVPVYDASILLSIIGTLFFMIFGRGVMTAQTSSVREDAQVHGRPGWVLENGALRVAILRGGGHIAEIRLLSSNPRLAINPMFVPAGNGYMGHMVCFPNFGPASPEERQNGIGGHGEANSVEWRQTRQPQIDGQGLVFFYGADLPKTQYRIERAVSLKNGESIVGVEEWIENLTTYDRPYNRDQHATFGAPFVESGKNVLDMSGTKGITDLRRTASDQWAPNREFMWPNAASPSGSVVSLREFKAVPGGQAYTAVLADSSRVSGWFTLYNSDYPLLVGYVFPTSDNPWIVDWQNLPSADSGAGTARGIEFGTSPVDEGLRKSVERGQLLGTPSFKFIGGRQKLSTRFRVFLSEIPAAFKGVQDVRDDADRLVLVERESGREIPVKTENWKLETEK